MLESSTPPFSQKTEIVGNLLVIVVLLSLFSWAALFLFWRHARYFYLSLTAAGLALGLFNPPTVMTSLESTLNNILLTLGGVVLTLIFFTRCLRGLFETPSEGSHNRPAKKQLGWLTTRCFVRLGCQRDMY